MPPWKFKKSDSKLRATVKADIYFNCSKSFACNLNAQENAAFSCWFVCNLLPIVLRKRLVCMYGLHCSWSRGFIRSSWRCLIGSVRIATNQRRRKDLYSNVTTKKIFRDMRSASAVSETKWRPWRDALTHWYDLCRSHLCHTRQTQRKHNQADSKYNSLSVSL